MTRALAVNAMMLLLVVGMTAVPASAQDPVPPPEALKGGFPAQKHFSPYAGRNFPTQVFWGDRDFTPADGQNRLPGAVGYTKGVPMGGDLRNAPAGKAPSFLVAALKGSPFRQPRPHTNRQRLGRCRGRAPGEGLWRCMVWSPNPRRRREVAAGG